MGAFSVAGLNVKKWGNFERIIYLKAVFRQTAVNNNKTNQTRINAKRTSYRTKQSSDNPNEILA
jgi:hypothetical protein